MIPRFPLLLLPLFLFLGLASFEATAESAYFSDIPDFTQTNVRGESFGNGQQFCAPAAVSNSLVWLHKKSVDQRRLVESLASPDYMNTDLKIGTGTSELLRGVDRYVRGQFGRYRTLSYQGWRKHPAGYSSGVKIPQTGFMYRGVSRKSASWINVGWYKTDKKSKEYRRVGGHWVTLVGFDADKNLVILHDPAPRAGQSKAAEYVSLRQLTGGRLTGNKAGLPTNAKGYYQLGRGMHLNSRADTAIIDGVVLLEL